MIGAVTGGALLIATLGFVGSYSAVRKLATHKGFGDFAYAFPIAVDAGIAVLLALDLLLTWRRIPYPMLRHVAWFLTGGTIAFNSAAAWGDEVAVGMHAVIPILFAIIVEAARHTVGRLADITVDRHIETPPLKRWLLSPISTYRIWRRQQLWHITSYTDVIRIERESFVYRAKLRGRYGRLWRRRAATHELLALRLARFGNPVRETLAEHETEVRSAETSETTASETRASLAMAETAGTGTSRTETGTKALPYETETGHRRETNRSETGGRDLASSETETSDSVYKTETARRDHTETAETTTRETGRETDTETRKVSRSQSRPKETGKVSPIGDRNPETEIDHLLGLMRDRGSETAVSLDDAITETGRPKSTAAKRLRAARDRYRETAA
ncbi:DUF2637 domain-containing protein [Kitasatospora sp. HUAS MG31]|uniref:DUF2637 domain-containing protein n=1 Tax=Kitasatospora camelliae TaxID=3156397 RepID=A0AAU8K634_9ACTN